MSYTDDDLVRLARNPRSEDSANERKTVGDLKDALKTVVAFANSMPIGYPGVLFVGVRDDGTIESPKDPLNFDTIQKTLNKALDNAYPPIPYFPRVVRHEGRAFLAVLVPGSPFRPHFAGPPWVRRGSESVKADPSVFEDMIASRSDKTREIAKWKGKVVGVEERVAPGYWKSYETTLVAYSQWWIVLDANVSWPLSSVEMKYDSSKERVILVLKP